MSNLVYEEDGITITSDPNDEERIHAVFVRSAYNYNVDAISLKTGLACLDVSRTIQSQKDEADINNIVKDYLQTGLTPQGVKMPHYADYEDVFDYASAQNAIKDAKDSFMQLPSKLRARFENDPGQFLEFCQDEANRKELEQLGMIDPAFIEKPGTTAADDPPK